MIMETEMDTDTDTDSDDDNDTVNIYEEVLNHENYKNRQHHGRLSTASSLYSSGGWHGSRIIPGVRIYQQQVKKIMKINVTVSFYFLEFSFCIKCSQNYG